MLRFPKQLYVVPDFSESTALFIALEHIDSIQHGVEVAVYELKETKRAKVTHELIASEG